MALTASSQASRLFKKSFGYGETSTINEWFEELNYRGPEIVLSNQIWSESGLIPSTTPWPSGTVSGASAGVIQYFDKVSMTAVPGINAGGKSFYLEDLKNSLGYSVADGSYGPNIFTSANVPISFGAGNWLVDHSAGLLTFYPGDSGGGLMPAGVNALNPPKISFYKYIGAIGVSASGGGSGTVYAGTGLTATGATLSVDFQSLSNSLAGNGLSASGGTLSVNVGNGLSISGDVVILGGTQTQDVDIVSDGFDFNIFDFNQVTLTGSIVDITLDNGSFLLDSGTQGTVDISTGIATLTADDYFDIDTPEVIVNADSVDINSTTFSLIAQDLVINIDSGLIDTANAQGLVYNNNYYNGFQLHSLVDRNYVDVQLSNLDTGLSASNVGNGLSIVSGTVVLGGTQTTNVNINSDGFDFKIENFDTLTFTGSLVDIQLDSLFLIDSPSIDIYGGDVVVYATGSVDIVSTDEFTVTTSTGSITTSNSKGLVYTTDYYSTFVTHSLIDKNYVDTKLSGLASQPFYQSAVSSVTTGDNSSTGISLTHTPNDYSRIQVFVNGQLQKLGDGSKTLDCYFSDDSGSTAKSLVNLSASDTLYWNGLITKYDLDAQDEVTIIYEY
jgi:hypothetical protein